MASENVRSWIIMELDNGKKYRYVRDVVFQVTAAGDTHYKGENGVNYWWTVYVANGDTGDTWGAQGDSQGKVLTDYNTIVTSWGDSGNYLSFPESAGDTYILRRRNYHVEGDTVGSECIIHTKIAKSHITDVYIVTEKKPQIINN